jgi:hypothetical protein
MAIHHLFSLFIKTIAFSCKQQYVYDESEDESVFCWFFFIQIFLSFATSVTCNLPNTIIKILVANVVYD